MSCLSKKFFLLNAQWLEFSPNSPIQSGTSYWILISVIYWVFITPAIKTDVAKYEDLIYQLEKKVDSLHSKNDLLENEADSLELKLEEYDEKIVKLNSRIYVIKKQTQKQLDAVDLFGDDELEQFFAKRYGQYTDSIN